VADECAEALLSDVWDLYDVRNDFSLSANVAAAQPAKLKQMQALFMKEAEKYHVLPIDDRTIERTNPALAGREVPAEGANGAILSQGGRFGGWSLYMKDGKPAYVYNFLGLARYTIAAPQGVVAGSCNSRPRLQL